MAPLVRVGAALAAPAPAAAAYDALASFRKSLLAGVGGFLEVR